MGEIEDRLTSLEETVVDLFGLMGKNQGQTALWRHRVEELEGRMATAEEEIAAEATAATNLAGAVKDLGTRILGHLATMQAEIDAAKASGMQVSAALQDSINAMNAEAKAAADIDPANPPAALPAPSTPPTTVTPPVTPVAGTPTDTTVPPSPPATP